MLIHAHVDVKGLFHRRHRALELHIHRIARAADHLETVGLRELYHRIVVVLSRSELVCELFHAEIVPVGRTGWGVKLLQEILQTRPVLQRKDEIELHGLRCGEPAERFRLAFSNLVAHVVRGQVPCLQWKCKKQGYDECEQQSRGWKRLRYARRDATAQ